MRPEVCRQLQFTPVAYEFIDSCQCNKKACHSSTVGRLGYMHGSFRCSSSREHLRLSCHGCCSVPAAYRSEPLPLRAVCRISRKLVRQFFRPRSFCRHIIGSGGVFRYQMKPFYNDLFHAFLEIQICQ